MMGTVPQVPAESSAGTAEEPRVGKGERRGAAQGVEPREGRSCTLANEPFGAGAVVAFHPDAGVDAEATARLPGEHGAGGVGLQEAALKARSTRR